MDTDTLAKLCGPLAETTMPSATQKRFIDWVWLEYAMMDAEKAAHRRRQRTMYRIFRLATGSGRLRLSSTDMPMPLPPSAKIATTAWIQNAVAR